MPFVLSNPLGFLALLGIPAILLIHFLQRRAQVIPCSTLFLLHQTQKESATGRKFDKLINSLALWMQLLIVLLITFLLVKPRYIDTKSTQRIAVVIDSSASMSVFKEQAKKKIIEEIPKLKSLATNIELWVLDSNISNERIYHGASIEDMSKALEDWEPQSGTANPHHVLRIARSLTGFEGAVVYITDTPIKSAPFNASVISVGSPKVNIGFTGVTYHQQDVEGEQVTWKASVRNYSQNSTTRSWHLETDENQKSEEYQASFSPGELKVLTGVFPKGAKRLKLVIENDDFILDDQLPLIKPEPKQLALYFHNAEKFNFLTSKFTTSFQNLTKAAKEEAADLHCRSAKVDRITFSNLPSIIFLDSPATKNNYKVGNIITADHALVEGLNWQKLLVTAEKRWKLTKWDAPLVWLDEEPIIAIREIPLGLGKVHKQLIFNFDITESNASQQESIALLLYRFFDQQRKDKTALQQSATELSQPLELKLDKKGRQVELINTAIDGKTIKAVKYDPKVPLNAPGSVGFFSVKQGDQYILHAANYFADTREADLSECEQGFLEPDRESEAIDQHSNQDHLWRVWTLLILLALLLSWSYSKEPSKAATT